MRAVSRAGLVGRPRRETKTQYRSAQRLAGMSCDKAAIAAAMTRILITRVAAARRYILKCIAGATGDGDCVRECEGHPKGVIRMYCLT